VIRRLFTLQPGLVGSAAAAVYVAAAMLYRALFAHAGVLAPDELVAAIAAVYALWSRTKVTPLARPRGAAGQPLVTAASAPPGSGRRPWTEANPALGHTVREEVIDEATESGQHWPTPEPPRM
jgi:hypothetical protein